MIKRITFGNDTSGKTGGPLTSPSEKTMAIQGNTTLKSQFPIEHFSSSAVTCHAVIRECHLDEKKDSSEGGVSLE